MTRMVYDDSGDAYIDEFCLWCDQTQSTCLCARTACETCGQSLPPQELEPLQGYLFCSDCADVEARLSAQQR